MARRAAIYRMVGTQNVKPIMERHQAELDGTKTFNADLGSVLLDGSVAEKVTDICFEKL